MTQRRYRRVSLFAATVLAAVCVLPSSQARAASNAAGSIEAPGLRGQAKPWRLDGRHLRAPVFPMLVADTVVTPAPVAPVTPVAPAPVVEEPRRVVHTDVPAHQNYMATMAWSAIAGGVLGAVVGVAIYYLDSGQRARNIAYWAAGGVLVGAGVGVIQIVVDESRADRAIGMGPSDPAPTLRFALYQRQF
jgi:hypothetical protein